MSIGPAELIIPLLILLVIIFGARRLPELGKSLGEGIKNFRTSMKEASKDDDAPPAGKNESSAGSPKS
jgi:sec-independent protein translocase protein TatA